MWWICSGLYKDHRYTAHKLTEVTDLNGYTGGLQLFFHLCSALLSCLVTAFLLLLSSKFLIYHQVHVCFSFLLSAAVVVHLPSPIALLYLVPQYMSLQFAIAHQHQQTALALAIFTAFFKHDSRSRYKLHTIAPEQFCTIGTIFWTFADQAEVVLFHTEQISLEQFSVCFIYRQFWNRSNA